MVVILAEECIKTGNQVSQLYRIKSILEGFKEQVASLKSHKREKYGCVLALQLHVLPNTHAIKHSIAQATIENNNKKKERDLSCLVGCNSMQCNQ